MYFFPHQAQKIVSQLDTMECRIPFRQIIFWMKIVDISIAEKRWWIGIKWAYLNNLLTTISITLLPLNIKRSFMKSILRSSYTLSRIDNSCNNPVGDILFTLCYWHAKYFTKNYCTCFFILDQNKLCEIHFKCVKASNASLQVMMVFFE